MRRCELGTAIGPAALGLACLLAGAARADFDPEAWRSSRDVKVVEGAAGEHARFALDDDVWDAAAGPGLEDLRLIRDETDDIGFAVYAPEKAPIRTEERPARVLNMAKRGEEAAELTLDLGETPPVANRIRLETPAPDFRCAVTIEGSDDGKVWKTLRSDGAIFAFAGDVARRYTAVSFPDARMRYLRAIVAARAGGKPIDLAGAVVLQEVEPGPPELPLLVERPVRSRTDTQVGQETRITLDLGARHLPVSKVAFATADENYSRRVRIEVGDTTKTLSEVGRGLIFRYRTEQYQEERVEVEFGEAFGRYVRVCIANGDDPPLAIADVTVSGRPRYVFFPFQEGRRYRLFYGNPQARPPQYDYAEVFRHIDRRAAIEARLAEPRRNPRFIATKTAPPPHPWVVRNQWVLYVVLAVAVVGLALVALRALRRTPVEPDADGG